MRQIVLDTETTGMRVEDGHRIIEIGCVEMIDRKLTGQHFHYYLNPNREVDAGALEVHGLTNLFLKDKPLFSSIAEDFLVFVSDSELIIHNAPFDLAFLNNELLLLGQADKSIGDFCRVIDTLQIARKLHVGQRNSLDALCKRYGIDNSKRDLHGALMDANLLAQVYLAMTGGQGSFFDALNLNQTTPERNNQVSANKNKQKYDLFVLNATPDELQEHEKYLQDMKKQGNCLWLEEES